MLENGTILNVGDAVRADTDDAIGFVVGLEGVSYLVDFGDSEALVLDLCDLNLNGLKPFFVTYGIGGNLTGCYSVVYAEDYACARDQIDTVTRGKFAFCYDEEQFAGQVKKYGLTKVSLQAQSLDPAELSFCRF